MNHEKEETIFDKILRREIPANVVYEDNQTFAFLDINPVNPGHVLVIPKNPSRNILDIDEKNWLALMGTVRKLARAVKEAMGADGINIDINNEPAAGQIIFYTHIHIVPRFAGDAHIIRPHKNYAEGEANKVAEKIKSRLAS
ncbi:HIT family protein [Patescibacteria group bacterium]|nr:HIT family protein [Patescibacteria group bacterium]